MGPRFVQIYGQGESPMTITALSRAHLADDADPRWPERIESVGVAQALVEVRVVDGDGNDLPIGATGEIVVRGDTVMAGYWRNPEATAQALRDGWLLDRRPRRARRRRLPDAEGPLEGPHHQRRLEHLSARGRGGAAAPSAACARSRSSAAPTRAGARWWSPSSPATASIAAALDALCLAHIARFKRPREYRFVAALPKNHYGKVLKTALREQLQKERPALTNDRTEPSAAQVLAMLDRAQALARRAMDAGHHPFGALLVGADHETVLHGAGQRRQRQPRRGGARARGGAALLARPSSGRARW